MASTVDNAGVRWIRALESIHGVNTVADAAMPVSAVYERLGQCQ